MSYQDSDGMQSEGYDVYWHGSYVRHTAEICCIFDPSRLCATAVAKLRVRIFLMVYRYNALKSFAEVVEQAREDN